MAKTLIHLTISVYICVSTNKKTRQKITLTGLLGKRGAGVLRSTYEIGTYVQSLLERHPAFVDSTSLPELSHGSRSLAPQGAFSLLITWLCFHSFWYFVFLNLQCNDDILYLLLETQARLPNSRAFFHFKASTNLAILSKSSVV